MEDIEDLAYDTYSKNIDYISKNHKDLMKLLNLFELAIDKNDYVQEFDLEYVENKYFDIKILKSNKFLYSDNSIDISKRIYRNIDTIKGHSSFEGLPIYNFSEQELKVYGEAIRSVDGLFPLMKYYDTNINPLDNFKTIDKYIFIGTGLGLHIELISKKIQAKQYLIIEDSLEIFKLSLFTTKYYEIAEDSLIYFAIAEDENVFINMMYSFLADDFFNNRFLKYTHIPTHPNNKIKQIQNSLLTQSFIFFPYKAELSKYLKPLKYINNGFNVVDLTTNFKEDLFPKEQALVLGAGPSLKENITWIKNNQKKFVIISASANLSILYANNIQPDIITHLDGSSLSLEHYKNIANTTFLNNTVMFYGANTPSQIRDMFSKHLIFSYEEATEYFKGFSSISTPCVGSFSLILALIFNFKDIYLLGLDLALNQETGGTHGIEDHVDYIDRDMSKKDNLTKLMGHTSSTISVAGNFKDTVYTTPLLHSSVQVLYRRLPHIKLKNQTIYNMCDGAKINTTIPTYIKEVRLTTINDIDKKKLHKTLIFFLELHSRSKLNDDDLKSIQNRLLKAYETKALIDKYKNIVSHSNKDLYLYDLLGLTSSILKKQGRESNNLSFAYYTYFKFALPIITDFFNTKELKNEKRHIKKLDKLFQDELYNICNIYIKELEEFIEEKC